MLIEIVGWLGTLLILLGYILNAKSKYMLAMYTWIVGDLFWISYDLVRGIYPHLGLSLVVIIINLYGIYKILKNKKMVSG